MDARVLSTEATGRQLRVFALGQFVVIKGDKLLSETQGRSRKVWDLFKYLIVNNSRILLPEVIAEHLWPDQPYDDPKGAVRTLIHRLRTLLGTEVELIRFNQGGYTFTRQQNVWLDIDAFEVACVDARKAAKQGLAEQALASYRHALSLYKGDLLQECAYSDWLIPLRSHFRRMYTQSVSELAALLKKQQAHAEIVEEVTRALLVDYFEEELHLILLEALLDDGKASKAKWHYENVTAVFYREMGLKPSPAMQRMLRVIKGRQNDNGEVLDFSLFREALHSRKQADGAFLCEPEQFNVICNLENRRAERRGETSLLLLLTATSLDFNGDSTKTWQEDMAILLDVLRDTLRKCDVICRIGQEQYMALLPATTPEQGQRILVRLASRLRERGLQLRSRVQTLAPPAQA